MPLKAAESTSVPSRPIDGMSMCTRFWSRKLTSSPSEVTKIGVPSSLKCIRAGRKGLGWASFLSSSR